MKLKQHFLLIMTIGILSACAIRDNASNHIVIRDAWIRAVGAMVENGSSGGTPSMDSNGAAYFVILNNSDSPDRLIGVQADFSQAAELHLSEMKDGVMRMQPVEFIEVPAKGEMVLQPGSYHVMLIGLKNQFTVGEKVELTLEFKEAGPIVIQAEVRSP